MSVSICSPMAACTPRGSALSGSPSPGTQNHGGGRPGVRGWASGLGIQHPAAGGSITLLLFACLFSSNKKVGMTHSIKKQKQSYNLLKGSCLEAQC